MFTFKKKLAEYILTFEGVANVATASELQNYNYTDGLNKFNKLGTHKDRSGDLIINLEPAWLEPFNWKDGNPIRQEQHTVWPIDTIRMFPFFGMDGKFNQAKLQTLLI